MNITGNQIEMIISTYLSRVLLTVITFSANILIARTLGVENVGTYAIILAISAILSCFLSIGLESAFLYYSSSKANNRYYLAVLSLKYSLGILLFVFLSLNIFEFEFEFIGYLPFLIVLSVFQSFLISIKIGSGELIKVNKVLIFSNVIYLCLLFFSPILGLFKIDVSVILILYLCNLSVTVAILFSDCYFGSKKKNDGNRVLLVTMLEYGKKSYLGSISGMVRLRAPILIISIFVVDTQVGIFSISQTILESFYIFPVVLSSLLTPKIANSLEAERKELVVHYVKIALLFISPMVIVCYFSKDYVIEMLYGQDFLYVSNLLNILLPCVFIYAINKIMQSFFYGSGLPLISSYSEFLTLLIVILLIIVFTPFFGIMGAAFAIVLASISQFIFLAYNMVKLNYCLKG